MIHGTTTHAAVSVVQIIVTSDENGNVQFFQDGRALGAFSLPEPDVLLNVLRQGGAAITDLRAADDLSSALASI